MLQASAKHVVVIQDGLHCALEHRLIDPRWQGEQCGLRMTIELLSPLDHPGHDRCQRDLADSAAWKFLQDRGVRVIHRQCDLSQPSDGLAFEDIAR